MNLALDKHINIPEYEHTVDLLVVCCTDSRLPIVAYI